MSQSPELAGGAGFTFEDAVCAFYLTALLEEGSAAGTDKRVVVRVALQQRDAGEPLDDLIVDSRGVAGEIARLSLQIKRRLVISAADSNSDLQAVVRDCWLTLKKADFRIGIDRFGAAVGEVASAKARGLQFISELAAATITAAEFTDRFVENGSASEAHRSIKADIVALIGDAKGCPPSPAEVWQFFSHFVLVEFDFLHSGGTSEPTALNALRKCLNPRHHDQAASAWAGVRLLVREGAGRSEIFDRPKLVRRVSTTVRLTGSTRLKGDLAAISNLTRIYLADIGDDVGGVRIHRASVSSRLDHARQKSRVVRISGLPGTGKSALLRTCVEAELGAGPVLFIKSGRLEGTSWTSFATANGLSGEPLAELLVEIAAVGSHTLFIDGIDRIEKQHRPIVVDLVREVLSNPLLDDCRIVMSLRDSGIEPLRNWLGGALGGAAIETVEVGELNDVEARVLAVGKPHLKPLLFGPQAVREVVRRPFFAKVLDQNFNVGEEDNASVPQSEVGLIRNWWDRGGYDAEGQCAFDRQRAIVELGAIRGRHLEREIAVSALTPATSSLIEQFVSDGILQHVKRGHTVRFAHDIFFEWAFFHVLVDRQKAWPEEIRLCGEPPSVARVVELLSQSLLQTPCDWMAVLEQLDGAGLRSQWTRAWLLAPFSAPDFLTFADHYAAVAAASDFQFLGKALVWFQAERTTPNLIVLENESIGQDERIRIADLLGWPSDFGAWKRFIKFLIDRCDSLPVRLRPDILAVFEVWQNAFAGDDNPLSNAILNLAAEWLNQIEAEAQAKRPLATPSPWSALSKILGDFRNTLARLLFQSSASRPELSRIYLEQILRSEVVQRRSFEEIIGFAPFLAERHSDQLVDLTLRYLKEELPEDSVARQNAERASSVERRKAARAIPLQKRTRAQELAAGDTSSMFGMHGFGHHDWRSLAIGGNHPGYFPASPLREPFHSLFGKAPDNALKLLRELNNHAMTAWCQLHRLSDDDHGTPIPLEVHLPWGIQQFWGTSREYLWSRALWGPEPILCGYLALEDWAFRELAAGRPADELAQKILFESQCIAALGVVAALFGEAETVSEVEFALLASQRLLMADEQRWQQDFGGSQSSLIGFIGKANLTHVEAVRRINALPARQRQLSLRIPAYFLMSGKEMSKRIKSAVEAFQTNLPFDREEYRASMEVCERLFIEARRYAELVNVENYRSMVIEGKPGQVAVTHISPTAAGPEQVSRRAESIQFLQQTSLCIWANKFFDDGELTSAFTPVSAIEFAKALETSPAQVDPDRSDDISAPGALAAAAAMALIHRDGLCENDLRWARAELCRALAAPQLRSPFWSHAALTPWHPGIYAARGIESDLRSRTADANAPATLLALVAHTLDCVSLAASGGALRLWGVDRHLSWSALHLGFSLCAVPPRAPSKVSEALHTPDELRAAVERSISQYNSRPEWPALPLPPPAWVRAFNDASQDSAEDEEGQVDESDLVDLDDRWVPSPIWWNGKYASKIIWEIPIEDVLAGDARAALMAFLNGHLSWTILKLNPPWIKPGRRDGSSADLYEWTRGFGRALGRAIGALSTDEAQQHFVGPILALEGAHCWDLLAPLVDSYVCRYIYDAQTVPADAPDRLLAFLEKVLADHAFEEGSHRAGTLTGFELPNLVETLLFVSIERAGGAARYVNGDWSEIALILPVVDRFVRRAGWSASIMAKFLTLCERAKAHYPAETFADQVLNVIEKPGRSFQSWHGTFLPARIAGLVQYFADRETPMPLELRQKLLQILDHLIDMGDRRSAALQYSEPFREVQIIARHLKPFCS